MQVRTDTNQKSDLNTFPTCDSHWVTVINATTICINVGRRLDLVQHSIAFCEGDVLRSHPLPFLGRSAPNNFKEALAPISFFPTSQKWVNFGAFPERSSDLMQNPMRSISALTLKASDPARTEVQRMKEALRKRNRARSSGPVQCHN